jgi:Flp pilus assembly protein TadD
VVERRGLKAVLASAVACWLLAGCAAQQNEGEQTPLNAESRLRVAAAAEASGDRDMAVSMYSAAAAEAPGNTPTQLRCAEGLARNGKMEDAAALLTRRLKTTPHDPEVLGTLGALQVLAGQPSQAVQTLSEVLSAKPDDVKALANKAVALDVMQRHGEAQRLYRQALGLVPGDPAISNDLALSLMLSGQAEEARRVLSPFRDVDGLPERMRINLGILDAAGGHAEEAHELLGSRIGAADLATLTAAIGKGGAMEPGQP